MRSSRSSASPCARPAALGRRDQPQAADPARPRRARPRLRRSGSRSVARPCTGSATELPGALLDQLTDGWRRGRAASLACVASGTRLTCTPSSPWYSRPTRRSRRSPTGSHQPVRGRGLATRAVKLVSAWAFDELGLERLWLEVGARERQPRTASLPAAGSGGKGCSGLTAAIGGRDGVTTVSSTRCCRATAPLPADRLPTPTGCPPATAWLRSSAGRPPGRARTGRRSARAARLPLRSRRRGAACPRRARPGVRGSDVPPGRVLCAERTVVEDVLEDEQAAHRRRARSSKRSRSPPQTYVMRFGGSSSVISPGSPRDSNVSPFSGSIRQR